MHGAFARPGGPQSARCHRCGSSSPIRQFNCVGGRVSNTLADPKFKDGDTLQTFDDVAANFPFSGKRWSTGVDPLDSVNQDGR